MVLFCFDFKGTLMIDCSVKSIDTFWGKQMKKKNNISQNNNHHNLGN